jgi:hypothetical protein
MAGKSRSFRAVAVAALVSALFLAPLISVTGCGNSQEPGQSTAAATETGTAFLNALGDQRVDELRSFFSQEYIDSNGVPDPITRDQLITALGYLNSYRFLADEDVTIDGDRAIIIVDMDITGKGEKEETLILNMEDGEWKVNAFTALDWSKQPPQPVSESAEIEQALSDFLIACIDGRTDYIYENLSTAYKDKYHLEKPWTSAEFSGIFGTARSFDFEPSEIEIDDDVAKVDTTVEFGTRGNLDSETSQVVLVKYGNDWLIDVFPFFIY